MIQQDEKRLFNALPTEFGRPDYIQAARSLKINERTAEGYVAKFCGKMGLVERLGYGKYRKSKNVLNEPVKKKNEQKKMGDFPMTPREMIAALYGLGYRIENNQLVCYQKITVNVKDIIKGQ